MLIISEYKSLNLHSFHMTIADKSFVPVFTYMLNAFRKPWVLEKLNASQFIEERWFDIVNTPLNYQVKQTPSWTYKILPNGHQLMIAIGSS